jgi:hypothetical protein
MSYVKVLGLEQYLVSLNIQSAAMNSSGRLRQATTVGCHETQYCGRSEQCVDDVNYDLNCCSVDGFRALAGFGASRLVPP